MKQPNGTQKYIVAWDFPKRPSGTFYRVLISELGPSHPAGEYELIQKSVALCQDDFIASRLGALAEYFGARVVCFLVQREGINANLRDDAQEFVQRVLYRRLHNRGRYPRRRKQSR
jgi:hypothetical protein